MKREDFMFTVGFQGNTAMVDRRAQRRYGRMSVDELLGEGIYAAAFRCALFDADEDAIERVRITYNEAHDAAYQTRQELSRLFGVDAVPDDVGHTRAL